MKCSTIFTSEDMENTTYTVYFLVMLQSHKYNKRI